MPQLQFTFDKQVQEVNRKEIDQKFKEDRKKRTDVYEALSDHGSPPDYLFKPDKEKVLAKTQERKEFVEKLPDEKQQRHVQGVI